MDLGLTGKRAIITGASRGIGRAIAEQLLAEGVSVGICARGAEGLESARAALSDAAGNDSRVFAQVTDLEDGDQTRAFVRDAVAALGGLDIFVHNASGMGGQGEDGWKSAIAIDIMAAVRSVEEAMPALEASDAAAIVLIGTTASMEAFGQPSAYAPVKAAMRAYCNDMAQALAPKGIRINVVSPGSIYFEGGAWDTVKQRMPDFYQQILDTIPMGRYGSAEEVARVATFIASPSASWVTGTNIVVDGGQHKGVD